MFIRSQDGTLLINTNNVSSIFYTDDNEIRVLYTFRDGGDKLGTYGNKDEVVQVFREITEIINKCDDLIIMPPQQVPIELPTETQTDYTAEIDGDG